MWRWQQLLNLTLKKDNNMLLLHIEFYFAVTFGNARICGPFHNFSIIIHIRWNIGLSVTPLQGIMSLQNFARAMTAQMLCHV